MSKALKLSRVVSGRGITADLGAFRNKIINGDFNIWQRGIEFNIAAGGADYTADRWVVYNTTNRACKVALFRFPNGDEPYGALAVTFDTAPTSGNLIFLQRIEGAKTLAGKEATITTKIAAPTMVNNAVFGFNRIFRAGVHEQDIALSPIQSFNANAGFVRKDAVVSIPPMVTTEALSSDYLEAVIKLEPRVAGTYAIARTALIEGDATDEVDPFPPRHVSQELHLCERYARRIKVRGLESAQFPGWYVQGATSYSVMRVNPTYGITLEYTSNVNLPLQEDHAANGSLSLRSQATAAGAAEFLVNAFLTAEL